MPDEPIAPKPRQGNAGTPRPSSAEWRRSTHGGEWRSDLDDPLLGMPKPAQNLVEAAKRLIMREGLAGLTLNAVAREAGENKAMTAYYFGNKDGLIATVHDSVVHDEYIKSRTRVDAVNKDERLGLLVQEMVRISALDDAVRIGFELTPHALRNEALGARLRELYAWYAEVKKDWLKPWAESIEPEAMQGLIELLAGVMDGMAIQHMLMREGFDMTRAYRVLETMLRVSLRYFEDGGALAEIDDGTSMRVDAD